METAYDEANVRVVAITDSPGTVVDVVECSHCGNSIELGVPRFVALDFVAEPDQDEEVTEV